MPVVVPVDTTAAGDSFNAPYVAARLAGEGPSVAATQEHRIAGEARRQVGSVEAVAGGGRIHRHHYGHELARDRRP